MTAGEAWTGIALGISCSLLALWAARRERDWYLRGLTIANCLSFVAVAGICAAKLLGWKGW